MTLFEWALKVSFKRLKPSSREVYACFWGGFEQRLQAQDSRPGQESLAQLASAIEAAGDYATQKRLYGLVRWVYRTLGDAGHPLTNHCGGLSRLYLRDDRPEHAALTDEAVTHMAKAARATVKGWKGLRLAAMLELLGETGLRTQELLALKKENFVLVPTPTISGGLGRNNRLFVLSPSCASALQLWLEAYPAESACPWLFIANTRGEQMDASTVWRQVKRMAAQALEPELSKSTGTGAIRASLAKKLEREGLAGADISRFLGHRLESSTGELLERVKPAGGEKKGKRPA